MPNPDGIVLFTEPAYRRRGFAREALQLMLRYATGYPSESFLQQAVEISPSNAINVSRSQSLTSLPKPIPPTCLICRISDTNTASISLFEKLGFRVTKHVQIFSEIEMRWVGQE